MDISLIIAILLIVTAIVIFFAKSAIPNSDIERLANLASIILFVFGVLSIFFPLLNQNTSNIYQIDKKTPSEQKLQDGIAEYDIHLDFTSSGSCYLKELVASFDKDEILSVEFEFLGGFFSKPSPAHVSFVLNGSDFEDGFRVDETLSYSLTHVIEKPGEYRVGFIWCGAYTSKVTMRLPVKNWQVVASEEFHR